MERRREIRSTIFKMVAWDVALLLLFMGAFLPSHLRVMGAIFLPTVLTFNVLFLNRSRRVAETPAASGSAAANTGKSSLYVCSGVFFAGVIGGLLTIIQGELPWTTLPMLLVPLLVAVYCLKMARRLATRKSKPDGIQANRPVS